MAQEISRRLGSVISVGLFFGLSVATSGQNEPLRLLNSAEVRTAVVTLGDFLPPDTPAALRHRAAGILLGNAPTVGAKRIFARENLARTLRPFPDLAAEIEVPEKIMVSRWSRQLTRVEVAEAIQKAVSANHFDDSTAIGEGDVTLNAPITLSNDTPVLEVMRYEPQEAVGVTRVALWNVSEPKVPPFWVTVNREMNVPSAVVPRSSTARTPAVAADAGAQLQNMAQQRRAGVLPLRALETAQSSAAPLVHAGKSVNLIVQGSGMRITAKAKALDTGREGQQVRVECEPAGKVLTATVVADATAEIDY